MTRGKNEEQNKINYSIWETRIDQSQLNVLERASEMIEGSNLHLNLKQNEED